MGQTSPTTGIPHEPCWLSRVEEDYTEGEITLIYERGMSRGSPRRLLFAVVELLPQWTGRQPDLPHPLCLQLNGSRKEINLARFHLPICEALAWYQALASGAVNIPAPPPRRPNAQPLGALPVGVGGLSAEPSWPNVVLEGPGDEFWDDGPLWGYRPGRTRRHAFIADQPIDPFAGYRAVDVEKAKGWLHEKLPIDIASRPVLWGSAHLVLPNPLLLDVEVRRGGSVVPEIVIEVVPRPGVQLDGLSLRLCERRPFGESTPILVDPLRRFNVVRLPDDPRENWLEISCSCRGLIYKTAPGFFVAQMEIASRMEIGSRRVELPSTPGGRGDDKYEVGILGAEERTTIGRAPGLSPAVSALIKDKALRHAARVPDPDEAEWFDSDPDVAAARIRGLIQRARRRLTIVDPYMGDTEILRFLVANPIPRLPITALTSAKYLRKEDYADRFAAQIKHVLSMDPNLDITVFVMGGERPDIHDRFLVVDDSVWSLGSSLNEFGSRGTMMIRLQRPEPVIAAIEKIRKQCSPLQKWVADRKRQKAVRKGNSSLLGRILLWLKGCREDGK